MNAEGSHRGRRTRLSRAAVLLFSLVLAGNSAAERPVKTGTTFSRVQCEYLGLDWRKTYDKVLDMGFDYIRLGAYWKAIEREEGEYDFSELDEQVTKAAAKKISIVLTAGMKAPRWPEFYIPEWALRRGMVSSGGDIGQNEYIRKKALEFVSKVVERYRNHPAVKAWQVENEPLNVFGEGSWYIGRAMLEQEIQTVRQSDGQGRRIILTAATYPDPALGALSRITTVYDPIRECLPLCDIVGLNVYPRIGAKVMGIPFYWYADRRERGKYFQDVLGQIRSEDKKVWIMELQAEPWEPGKLVYKGKHIPRTAVPGDTLEYAKEIIAEGVDVIFLWGAEYWVYRQEKYEDTSWYGILENIRKEVKPGDAT